MELNEKNYYQDKEYLNYHSLKDYMKCEFLYKESVEGKVPKMERPYFVYGTVFDELASGTFEENCIVGTNIDPLSAILKIEEDIDKSVAMIEKYKGKSGKMADSVTKNHTEKLVKLAIDKEYILKNKDKMFVSEAVVKNASKGLEDWERHSVYTENKPSGTGQTILTGIIGGVKAKGKLDNIDPEKGVIIDYKTTAKLATFEPMNYVGQMAWYRELAKQTYPEVEQWQMRLYVSDKDPYNKHSAFYQFEEETLDRAMSELLSAVEKFQESKDLKLFQPTEDRFKCLSCPHYNTCPFTKQSNFIKV